MSETIEERKRRLLAQLARGRETRERNRRARVAAEEEAWRARMLREAWDDRLVARAKAAARLLEGADDEATLRRALVRDMPTDDA